MYVGTPPSHTPLLVNSIFDRQFGLGQYRLLLPACDRRTVLPHFPTVNGVNSEGQEISRDPESFPLQLPDAFSTQTHAIHHEVERQDVRAFGAFNAADFTA